MDRLMIADDEKIVIDSLCFIINKNFPGEFEIFTARSGREAILIAEQNRIDIGFMDISMPGINGIQAIERIRETHPDIVFVILTAFDKFDYAKTALHLGVFEYLLKPIKREKIIEVLTQVRQRVDKRKRQRLAELDISERLEKANIMLEKELVSSVISPRAELSNLGGHMRILEISEVTGYCLLLEFDNAFVDRNGVSHGQGEAVGSDYYSVCEQIKAVGSYLAGSLVVNRMVALRLTLGEISESDLLLEAETIRAKLAERLDTWVKIGVGSYFPSMEGASGSYFAAVLALRFSGPQSPVISYSQIRDSQIPEGRQREDGSVSKPVQQTIAYIDQHFDRNLTLDLLANMAGMSPNYFSKLFKDEAGCNFIDYLTRVRIGRAKLMLAEKKWSVKEVALATGYKDSGYFTRTFKKITGVVPSDYLQPQ